MVDSSQPLCILLGYHIMEKTVRKGNVYLSQKNWTGAKSGPGGPKVDPPLLIDPRAKVLELEFVEMEMETSQMSNLVENDSEDVEGGRDLVQEAYVYLTEHRYPPGCISSWKRSIRKKAGKFVVREGEMFFKKKRKGKVRSSADCFGLGELRLSLILIRTHDCCSGNCM